MTDHISPNRMEEFCARTLSATEFVAVGKHLAHCEICTQTFREVFRERRNYVPVSVNLSLEHQLKDEHLEDDQVSAFVDNGLDEIEREMANLHLKTCVNCRESIGRLIESRERIAVESSVAHAPSIRPKSRKTFAWLRLPSFGLKPALAATLAVAVILSLLAWFAFKKDGNDRRQIDRAATETPLPNAGIVSPSPGSSPQLPVATPDTNPPQSNRIVASLNDNGRKLLMNSAGQITGLTETSPELTRSIKEALLNQSVARPDVLASLNGVSATLRGLGVGKPPFKLLSPNKIVIVDARPVFRWEALPDAASYQVFVGDLKQRQAVVSEHLPPAVTEWTPATSLKRGGIYSWSVVATVNGKEITSPGASASEVKFKVLTERESRELARLKGNGSRLALGVFYANAGMVAEAEQEFQSLADDNPRSPIAAGLLRAVQAWR